jgi:hypothetical protein
MKKWEQPKLICLVRSRPEEAVLTVCKGPPDSHNAANNHYGQCLTGNCKFQCHQPTPS